MCGVVHTAPQRRSSSTVREKGEEPEREQTKKSTEKTSVFPVLSLFFSFSLLEKTCVHRLASLRLHSTAQAEVGGSTAAEKAKRSGGEEPSVTWTVFVNEDRSEGTDCGTLSLSVGWRKVR